MQYSELRLVIVLLKLVMWINRVHIWLAIIQNLVEFLPLKAELLLRQRSSFRIHLDWSFRKVCVCEEQMIDTEQGSLEYKQISQSWSVLHLRLVLLDFFFFFLMITFFFLFLLALPPTTKPPRQTCWAKLPEY